MITLLGSVLLVAAMPQAGAVMQPTEAVALADARRGRGVTGTFEMKVAAAQRTREALYLNSNADYRSPDDLTFRLTPQAARKLQEKLGAAPETALVGRTVRVKGMLKLMPIVNVINGTPRSYNRFQHEVSVRSLSNLTVE